MDNKNVFLFKERICPSVQCDKHSTFQNVCSQRSVLLTCQLNNWSNTVFVHLPIQVLMMCFTKKEGALFCVWGDILHFFPRYNVGGSDKEVYKGN